MKERPILFSAPMIRALLAGTKTQTRRILKVPHENPLGKWEVLPWGGPNGGRTRDGKTVPYQNVIGHTRTGEIIACPYGQPGDRLWVRETWRIGEDVGEGWSLDSEPGDLHLIYDADGARDYRSFPEDYRWPSNGKVVHNSEGTPDHWISYGSFPSIFLPRWASRITLEITAVRVERLQDISEADARAEGCTGHWVEEAPAADQARFDYRELWEQINGPGSWDANPWVWVVSFKRVKGGAA